MSITAPAIYNYYPRRDELVTALIVDAYYSLAAPQVNALAYVAVIHGGQGTVQTTCWAGTPVVGVGFQFEQDANLEMLVRAGMGVRIPLREFSGERVLADVSRVVDVPSYQETAARFQTLVRATDGVTNTAKAILDFLATK